MENSIIVHPAFRKIIAENQPEMSKHIKTIISQVAQYRDITRERLLGQGRTPKTCMARDELILRLYDEIPHVYYTNLAEMFHKTISGIDKAIRRARQRQAHI